MGVVESECGRTWSEAPDPVTKIRRVDPSGRVVLPRPVASVDSVNYLELDGTTGASASGWQFDGIDSIFLPPYHLVLNATYWVDKDQSETVQVTWTPAASTTPAAVAAVALALAARIQGNPAGASSLSIDDYSQGFTAGAGVGLLPSEKSILAKYRSRGIVSQGVQI